MAKSADAFRTISEVADWLDTPAHVLRFWESKFSQVKPVKRAGGRRYYRPQDMKLLGGIKKLLHDDGMTIKGVQKLLREQGVKSVSMMSQPLAGEAPEILSGTPAPAASEVEAQVLSFRRDDEPTPSPTPDTEAPHVALSDVAASQAPDEPPIATEPAPEPVPDTTDDTPLIADAPSHEPPARPLSDTPAEIPAFLSRASRGGMNPEVEASAPVPDVAEPEAAQDPHPVTSEDPAPADVAQDSAGAAASSEAQESPEESPPRPLIVEVPADPDDVIAADPGVIAMINGLAHPISPALAAQLSPLIDRLQATLEPSN